MSGLNWLRSAGLWGGACLLARIRLRRHFGEAAASSESVSTVTVFRSGTTRLGEEAGASSESISAIIGFGQLDAVGRFLMIGALVAYLLGVQLPTMVVNVPLNNQLQTLDIDALNDAELRTARDAFESRWNRWNVIRTVLSVLATGLLIVVVLRL